MNGKRFNKYNIQQFESNRRSLWRRPQSSRLSPMEGAHIPPSEMAGGVSLPPSGQGPAGDGGRRGGGGVKSAY